MTRAGDEPILDREDETTHEKVSELTDLLGEFGAAVSFGPNRYTVRLALEVSPPEAVVSEAINAVTTYADKAGLPNWPFIKIEATEWEQFEQELDEPTFPNIIGVSELAQILDVSRQRASELARAAHFPKPFAGLASGPVWLEPTIRRFVAEWERRPGRPRSAAG
ncbi:MAG: hypothetical protein ACRDKB_05120 [Actinomycetota bacterium]